MTAFVVRITRWFTQDETALRLGKIDAPPSPPAGDGGVVGGGVIAQQTQLETALPRGCAVAFAGVTTGLCKTRKDIGRKMPRSLRRLCQDTDEKQNGNNWPSGVHFCEWSPMKARPAICA